MKRRLYSPFLIGAMVLATGAWAQDPAPFPEFTFKRVKVPTSGSGNRINVQIDPSAVVAPPKQSQPEKTDAPAPAAPLSLPFDWYWAKVSPSLTAASSGRLVDALNVLTNGPVGSAVPTPRLQDMQEIAKAHGVDILKATIGTKVSPALVLAVIGIESSGRSNAVSSAGAQGLMQLMPATAERFGVTDSTVPADNIRGGVAYLNWLMEEFGGDPVLILAAYNAGENSVIRHEGVPPFAETRAYVPKVLAAWMVARGLCLTPPMLMSDGCVFAANGVRKNG